MAHVARAPYNPRILEVNFIGCHIVRTTAPPKPHVCLGDQCLSSSGDELGLLLRTEGFPHHWCQILQGLKRRTEPITHACHGPNLRLQRPPLASPCLSRLTGPLPKHSQRNASELKGAAQTIHMYIYIYPYHQLLRAEEHQAGLPIQCCFFQP